jgi:nucleoside-diphosphate-sugar epimerase
MKNILLCGATGFIGRNLLEHFANNSKYKVRAVYHNKSAVEGYDNVEWCQANLNDPSDVGRIMEGIDVVLQFAATTSGAKDITTKPFIHVTDNAVMNSLLLRSAYENNVEHFVFPSCTVMYQPSEEALSEDDFSGEDEIYSKYFGVGNTKVYIEKMCDFYSRLGRTKHTVIRHSNIYGPHDKYDLERSHVFGATVTKVMTAKDKVVMWGTGEEKRDLLHVDDLCRFVELALENQSKEYELFNVGLGQAVPVRDLVQKMITASGKNLKIESDLTKPTIKTSLYLDWKKAFAVLGWCPQITLDKGIEKTLKWYRENIDV